jgi:hypothetical protein
MIISKKCILRKMIKLGFARKQQVELKKIGLVALAPY